MSCSSLFVACAVTAAGAARIQNRNIVLGSSMLDSVGRHGDNPEEFWASLNSGLLETNHSWFWRRDRAGDEPAATGPVGGTNPAWAAFRPTILAIDGSDNLGQVSSVYTFGAPSSAKVALTDDNHGDGCFDGYRIFSGSSGARDPVSWLASSGGFVHSRMKAMTLYSGEPPWILPCSESTTHFPPSDSALQIALHFTSGYLQTVREERLHIPQHVETYAALMRTCYVNRTEAADLARGVGYRFVAEAVNGDDLTRLFQNPDTSDCIISFRGSDNAGDWINNAAVGSRSFCNFEDVHSGFVEKFTNTVTASQFQTNIRANLPKCASVRVTGHSLGGAVAEMFSGCVNRGAQGLTPLVDLPRGSGLTVAHRGWMEYMSYKGQIAWNRGMPEPMPPIA